MAERVFQTLQSDSHLLVQAGTGTGKSFGYLLPLMYWSAQKGRTGIVSTATLALQRQIVSEDAPLVADLIAKATDVRLSTAILKGWNNYACLKRVNEVIQDALLPEDGATDLGKEVVRARTWALETETGDRDDLTPGVPDLAWRQVSVTKQECEGKDCPFITECFPEKARAAALEADIVITNHAMLGVEAGGIDVLPPAEAIIVDEAHELVSRVTNQLTVRLGLAETNRIARMIRSSGKIDAEFARHAATFQDVIAELDGRLRVIPDDLRELLAALSRSLKDAVESEQWSRAFQSDIELLLAEDGQTVMWVREGTLYGAPLDVATSIANRVFEERAAVLTSATLKLGDSFTPMAHQVGLALPSQGPWEGMDAGSPFDYQKQAILYAASDLPAPSREGQSFESLERMVEMISASGGGALGLFSSRKAAEEAAEYLRARLDTPVYCQGEDSLPTLVENFRDDDSASLVGTLSLWQGIDVPGRTCRLVIIDKIPFPRPDDPVTQARTELVGRRGGNGFMQVSATTAAILLAQGAGRLLRRIDDRGVVAIMDSRIVTRAYGGFMKSSMPDMWPTTSFDLVLKALKRLRESE